MPVSSRDRQTAARSCSARTSVTTDPTGRAAVNNPEARWVLSEIPAACTVINDRKLVRNRRSSVANEQASGAMILQHHVADAAQDLGPRRRSRHALHRAAVRSGQRHAAGGAYRHHSETFASPGSSPSGRHRGAGPAPVRRHRAKPSGPNRPQNGRRDDDDGRHPRHTPVHRGQPHSPPARSSRRRQPLSRAPRRLWTHTGRNHGAHLR